MDKQNKYYRQVKLLVQTLPHIAKVQQFALKGITIGWSHSNLYTTAFFIHP